MGGVLDQIRNSFVERQQDTSFPECGGNHNWIGGACQVLVGYLVGVMAGQMQIRGEIDRQIFVKLEFHRSCRGINCSSRANSAAYARAASICSGRSEG